MIRTEQSILILKESKIKLLCNIFYQVYATEQMCIDPAQVHTVVSNIDKLGDDNNYDNIEDILQEG